MLLREAVIVTKSPQEPVVLPPSESWIQFLFKGTLVFLFEGKKCEFEKIPLKRFEEYHWLGTVKIMFVEEMIISSF